jgi:hypothetical protein
VEKQLLEVEGLYKVVHLKRFRETKGVRFDILPKELLTNVAGVDRVIHEGNAVSPGAIGDVLRPWYMHTHQSDNLLVLHGERHVDLYSTAHGKIERFVVTSNQIFKNGELLIEGPAMLVWPPNVFHRVESKEKGSASLNFAYRSDGFNVDDNFSIYDLNTETKEFKVIRVGSEDQF